MPIQRHCEERSNLILIPVRLPRFARNDGDKQTFNDLTAVNVRHFQNI